MDSPPIGAHPMDVIDRDIVFSLEQVVTPTDADIVNTARLVLRYEGSLLSADLLHRLRSNAQRWGLSRVALMERARHIWQSGWKPSGTQNITAQAVGSGADVEG